MPHAPSTPRKGRDWGRTSDPRMPKNYIAMGTVGHTDDTPSYVRIEGGDVFVEVTLTPAGDEVVARLDMSAVDGGGIYMPLSYGQRVVLAMPGGTGEDPVLIGRMNDSSWPFPSSVAGVSTGGTNGPMFAFYKTQDGQLLAIQTGDGGDVLIHSGASAQVQVDPGEQILLTGQTHIGADFTAPPTGSVVGKNGTVTAGVAGTAFVPLPNTNTTIPPPADVNIPPVPLPADGIFRIKDTVQSNITIDAAFWAWVIAVSAATAIASVPTTLTSQPASGSKHTADDG